MIETETVYICNVCACRTVGDNPPPYWHEIEIGCEAAHVCASCADSIAEKVEEREAHSLRLAKRIKLTEGYGVCGKGEEYDIERYQSARMVTTDGRYLPPEVCQVLAWHDKGLEKKPERGHGEDVTRVRLTEDLSEAWRKGRELDVESFNRYMGAYRICYSMSSVPIDKCEPIAWKESGEEKRGHGEDVTTVRLIRDVDSIWRKGTELDVCSYMYGAPGTNEFSYYRTLNGKLIVKEVDCEPIAWKEVP